MNQAGLYYAEFVSGEVVEAGTGSLQLCLDVSVTHVDDGAGGWAGIEERLARTIYVSLSDKAMKYSRSKLQKIGFLGDFGNPMFSKPGFEVECKHEMYDGELREKWELPHDGERIAANDGAISLLNAKWAKDNAPPSGRPTPASAVKPKVAAAAKPAAAKPTSAKPVATAAPSPGPANPSPPSPSTKPAPAARPTTHVDMPQADGDDDVPSF